MKKNYICFLLFLLPSAFVYSFGEITLPFKQDSTIGLGKGVDIDFPSNAKAICLKYSDADIKWDSDGPIKTFTSTRIINTYEKLAETNNIDTTSKSKSDVGFSVFKAAVTTNFEAKYKKFRTRENETLAVVFQATASYGRKSITQYELKEKYLKYIEDGEFNKLFKECGTHIAVSEQRESKLSANLLISNLNTGSKETINSKLDISMSGSGSLEAVKFGGEHSFSASFERIVDTAAKLGSITLEYQSEGGGNVPAAAKIPTSQIKNAEAILTNLNSSMSSFTKENSAVIAYNYIPISVFGGESKEFDEKRYLKLQELFRSISKIDTAKERMQEIKENHEVLYNKYYASQDIGFVSIRSALITMAQKCSDEFKCDEELPEIEELFWLNDLIINPQLVLSCTYHTWTPIGEQEEQILSNISVNLYGDLRFFDYLDTETVIKKAAYPKQDIQDITHKTGTQLSVKPTPTPGEEDSGLRKVFATIDHLALRPDHAVPPGQEKAPEKSYRDEVYELTVNNLRFLNETLYIVNISTNQGFAIDNIIGTPFSGDCAPIKTL